MSEYSSVRSGKLKLKGGAGSLLKKKKKGKRKRDQRDELGSGELKHGRWRTVTCLEDVRDTATFETYTGGYMMALDSGYFVAGEVRDEAEQPDPAEVFTVVRVLETKVALKTGYGRYVSINTAGELTGRAEAIGPRETWEPVFEDGKLALCASTHRFVTVTSDNKLMALSEQAKEKEILTMRCNTSCYKKIKTNAEEEEELSSHDLGGFETDYVKKFQSFNDHKLHICSDSKDSLEKAKHKGKLHEALLDRREKMKADRYCK